MRMGLREANQHFSRAIKAVKAGAVSSTEVYAWALTAAHAVSSFAARFA